MHFHLRLGLKLKKKKKHCILELNQSQWLKLYIEFNTQKRIEAEKIRTKRKSVVQINEQCYIQKKKRKLEKQNQCKTSKQRKRLFKMYIKTRLYVAQNIQQ